MHELSPGQTDWQVAASGRKLNLRRNLRWVTKRIRKFPRKYTQVANKNILRQLSSISLANNSLSLDWVAKLFACKLANNRLMDVTRLALTWIGWPNGEKLASTCVQI